MGMSIRSSQANRRLRRPMMAEINMTPFVDVMLVLLIIFMVTAPMMSVNIPVNLPQVKSTGAQESKDPLTITLTRSGEIYIQESKVDPRQLVPQLKAITKANANARIYVRGDRHLNYGTVMQLMGQLHAAGFQRVGLVASHEKPN